MPEVATTSAPVSESRGFDAASLARLRSLTRPGYSPKTVLKSVSAFEIASLVLLVVLFGSSVLVYSFWILPDQVRFVQLTNEVSGNQQRIEDLQGKIGDPNLVTSQYQEVLDSLDTFRGSVLKPRIEGKQAILEALDKSVRETGVSWAGAVEFKTDEAQTGDASKKQREKSSKVHSVASYPGLEMDISISGSYAQLRSFIARFEGSNQFVVINSVSLSTDDKESDDEGGGPRRSQAHRPAPGDSNGTITLDIGMTAYFQPSAAQ